MRVNIRLNHWSWAQSWNQDEDSEEGDKGSLFFHLEGEDVVHWGGGGALIPRTDRETGIENRL